MDTVHSTSESLKNTKNPANVATEFFSNIF